ncbi:MAG: hypothetical protein ACKPKO_49875, partial [Candidatus Fonsibacter sp.]
MRNTSNAINAIDASETTHDSFQWGSSHYQHHARGRNAGTVNIESRASQPAERHDDPAHTDVANE